MSRKTETIQDDKRVCLFRDDETYAIDKVCLIYAHPFCDTYKRPQKEFDYIALVKPYGIVDSVYRITDRLYSHPNKITELKNTVKDELYERLSEYVRRRKNLTFGFGTNDVYVYYCLEKVSDVDRTYTKKGLRQFAYDDIDLIPVKG